MKVIELKKELDKIIAQGQGDTNIYFDVEGREWDSHIVSIDGIGFVGTNIIDEKSYVILRSDYWK